MPRPSQPPQSHCQIAEVTPKRQNDKRRNVKTSKAGTSGAVAAAAIHADRLATILPTAFELVPIPRLWDRFSNLSSDRLESRSHRGFEMGF